MVNKIKHLGGLRGVAAVIVMFYHLKLTCFITQHELVKKWIFDLNIITVFKLFLMNSIEVFLDGQLAVWIFWVLSSYVISILFFKENANYDKIIIGYFTKRYFRLFIPVAASIFLAYILLKAGFIYNAQLANVLGDRYSNGWLNLFYTFPPNFLIALKSAVYNTFFNYQLIPSYNANLWTIQNEFLGSLFTFSIFGVIRHNSRRFILYFVILFIVVSLHILWLAAFIVGHVLCDYDFSITDDKILNFLRRTEARIHEFAIPIFIISIIFIVLGKNIQSFIKIPSGYHDLFQSIFIVYICLRNKYFKNIFSLRISNWLGDISFGLYLIHLPVICSLTCFMILANCTLQGKLIATFVTIVVILISSHFFDKYIDKNSVKFANKIGDYFKKYTN